MKKYINNFKAWGGPVEVTPADYYRQADAFGIDITVDVDERGININGERVATVVETPDTLATVERLAERANMSIDMRGGPLTRRDGMWEIYAGETGGHSDCISREPTEQDCISAACKYLRKLVAEHRAAHICNALIDRVDGADERPALAKAGIPTGRALDAILARFDGACAAITDSDACDELHVADILLDRFADEIAALAGEVQ